VIALQVTALVLVAVAMGLALAHALEFPGKLRLTREQYLATQSIYYPGFTIGGIAEPVALVALAVLVWLTPAGTVRGLTIAALAAIAAMHATYWLLTHPVNGFWTAGAALDRLGRGFFAFDPLGRGHSDEPPDWTRMRDRWEVSHVVRAAFGLAGLILLATALAL